MTGRVHGLLLRKLFSTSTFLKGPIISQTEFALRRHQLAAELPPSSIAIVPGGKLKYRTGKTVFYPFHQEPNASDGEPESLLVIAKRDDVRYHLLVQPNDEKAELWEGKRNGVDGALRDFGADNADSITNIFAYMKPLIETAKMVYFDLPGPHTHNTQFFSSKHAANSLQDLIPKNKIRPLTPIMQRLRLKKSSSEIACMREAGGISGKAFNKAMGRVFDNESKLAAFLDYQFRIGGCENSAYVPVVAGSHNGLTIHYTKNNAPLQVGDLCLVDAGGQYQGYASDITRTWPIGGQFSAAQKALYQAVLNVQKQCIKLCTEKESISVDHLQYKSERFMREELLDLGFDLVEGDVNRVLYPHSVGHGIGLDLHEPLPSRIKPLVEGQTITVEPAVYVPPMERWPKHFHGMAIRIEDTVCVTSEDPFILTVEAAKEIVDIENIQKDHGDSSD